MRYKQFCPIAKGMEVLGEKWTLLIVRELLMGSTHFNQFQKGLPGISPALLTKRLTAMEQDGLVIRKRISGQRGFEYLPTSACRELAPVLEQVGIWGMHWARQQLEEDEFALEPLMLYLQRSIQPDNLPGDSTIVHFHFTDVQQDYANWWLVVTGSEIDVCIHDPGREVDVYFNVGVRAMCAL